MNNTAKLIKLGNIADVMQGQSPESEYYSEEIGTPFLQGNRTFGNLYPVFDTYTTKVTKLARQGDVLMSVRAPVGDLNIAPSDLCIGRGLASLRSKVGSNYFIYYSLKHSIANLQRQGAATTYSSVNKDIINEFDVIVPNNDNSWDLIAKFLFNIDKKIELNNKLNQQLEDMAKFLYDYWFVQFDFPDENGKPYKSTGGKMVWNDEVKREIPAGWEVVDLCKLENNVVTGKTPSTSNKEYYGNEIPFITIGDIRGNMHITDTEIKLSVKGADSQKNKYIPAGSLCVTCIASPGLIGFSTELSQTNQQINSVVIKNKENKTYLYFALKDYFKYSPGAKAGNTFANMNKGDFESIKLISPPKELKIEFEETVRPSVDQLENNSKQNYYLAQLRDWLLPLLMNGQVSVKAIDEIEEIKSVNFSKPGKTAGLESIV